MQRRHDPTYYWATRSLPGDVRPATHALYGYVRTADEIVDGPDRPASPHARRAALDAWEDELERGLAAGRSPEPVVGALVDAGLRHDLPLGELRSYMRSMRIDCAPVRIATWEELEAYMDGSAGSVGRIMASLLGVPACHHVGYGRLGLAFQLTNFIRDVREDTALDRNLPPRGGARALWGGRAGPRGGARITRVARARRLPGPPRPRPLCRGGTRGRRRAAHRPAGVRLAVGIYRRVLDRAEQVDFDVLGRRAGVRPWQLPGAAVEAVGHGTAFRQRRHPPGAGDEAVPHGTAFGHPAGAGTRRVPHRTAFGHPAGAGDEAVPP
jgi:phytoene synthase